jgi:hypothetical protein
VLGAHDRARVPALEDVPQALRAVPGRGRDDLALPHAEGDQGRAERAPPRAASTC